MGLLSVRNLNVAMEGKGRDKRPMMIPLRGVVRLELTCRPLVMTFPDYLLYCWH
jgi:hypothetical protein